MEGRMNPRITTMLCVLWVLSAPGLVGCGKTMHIAPLSGPVGTNVCFNPAPPTGFDSTLERCGWFIELQKDGTTQWAEYTVDQCFTMPSNIGFLPGDEIFVEVTGDWGQIGFECGFQKVEVPELLSLYQYYGTFLLTE
jgi:hypothetical protein